MTNYAPLRLFNLLNELSGHLNENRVSNINDDYSSTSTSQWTPPVDIIEDDKVFIIHAEVPGIDGNTIQVFVENNILFLKGEKKLDHDDTKYNCVRTERVGGVFHRRFVLPETANLEAVSAKTHDGVLEIVIPKKEKAQTRKIEVAVNPKP